MHTRLSLGALRGLFLVVQLCTAEAAASQSPRAYGREAVFCHAVSARGAWAAGARRSHMVELYDENLVRVSRLRLRDDPAVLALEFSPDERRLAAADEDGGVLIWDLATVRGRLVDPPIEFEDLELNGEDDERREVALSWSPDSTRLLVQRTGGPRALYSSEGDLVRRIDVRGRMDGDLDALWRESTHALLLRQSRGVTSYDWRTGELSKGEGQATSFYVGEAPSAFGLSPDGEELVVSSAPMKMTFFDTTSGEETRHWRFTNDFSIDDDNQFCQLRYSPDGSKIAYSSFESRFYGVLDVTTLVSIYDSGHAGGHFRNVHFMRWLPGSNDTLSVYYECCPRRPQLLLLEPKPRWQDTQELWIPRFSDRGGIALQDGELAVWTPDPPPTEEPEPEQESANETQGEGR